MSMAGRNRAWPRFATSLCVLGLLLASAREGTCSNAQEVSVGVPGTPGVSVITLRGAKIVITETSCSSHQKLKASDHIGKDPCLIGVLTPGDIAIRAKTRVSSIMANVGKKEYRLPSDGLLNAWGGGRNENVHTKNRMLGGNCYDSDDCIFRGVFDQGRETCAVAVQWEIVAGRVSRTVFTCSGDLVGFFESHIEPPSNVTVYN